MIRSFGSKGITGTFKSAGSKLKMQVVKPKNGEVMS